MPATRAKASPLAVRSSDVPASKQVAEKKALKFTKKKAPKKTSARLLAIENAVEAETHGSESPTTNAERTSTAPPSSEEFPALERLVVELSKQKLINTVLKGQVDQQRQLDFMIKDTSAIRASINALDKKMDRILAQNDKELQSIKDASSTLNDLNTLMQDLPVTVTDISEKIDSMEDTLSSVDDAVGSLSNIESAVGDIESAVIGDGVDGLGIKWTVNDIHAWAAEEKTSQLMLQRMDTLGSRGTSSDSFLRAIFHIVRQVDQKLARRR